MTDDEVRVEISSSSGGIENTVKIRNEQDLQVAVEALELAARYEFSEVNLDIRSDSSGEELSELVEDIKQVEKELDGVEDDVDEILQESVSDSDLEAELSDLQKQFNEKFSELISELDEQHTPGNFHSFTDREKNREDSDSQSEASSEDDQEQKEEDAADETEETGEDSSYMEVNKPSKTVPELVEDGLVDVDTPVSYSEFKDLTETEQQVAIFESLKEIQPATKVEVADDILETNVDDSNGKRAKYVESRLRNQMSDFVDQDKRSTARGKNPYEYAEEGFDFESSSEEDGDAEEEAVEQSSVERNAEAMAEDAPSTAEKGAYDLEWMTIDEAVEEYKSDMSTKYILCIRSMTSFTSTIMAEKHAEEGEGAVWAVSEELIDDFVR